MQYGSWLKSEQLQHLLSAACRHSYTPPHTAMVKTLSAKVAASRSAQSIAKKPSPKLEAPTGQVDATEHRLIRNMSKAGLGFRDIQYITCRSSQTIALKLADDAAGSVGEGSGRPKEITPAQYKKLKKAWQRLLKREKGEKEVTVDMIKAAAGIDCCNRVILDAFHEENIWFQKLKEKPVLEDEDVVDRSHWTKAHAKVTEEEWVEKRRGSKSPHAVIDGKKWPLYLDQQGRAHVARRCVRGAYQQVGAVPDRSVVRPKKEMKFSAPGIYVQCAVIKGRVAMWEYMDGSWNGEEAANMYKGPLLSALKKAYPGKPNKEPWVVLEDNDPAGYKSGKARRAKESVNIVTDDLPRRSPDLNVLDYYVWHAVNMRMRAQERTFRKSFKESKKAYLKRLRQTALRLSRAELAKAMKGMRRRVLAIKKEGGGLIKE